MSFYTRFKIGDRVRFKHTTFTVGQIRILTLTENLFLIEYRAEYSTGRNGPWRAERYLEPAP